MAKQNGLLDNINWNYVLYIGGAIAIYKIVGEPILQALNVIDTDQEKADRDTTATAIATAAAEIAKTQSPTKTDAEWQMIAKTIYEDLKYSSLSDDKEDAGYQLARAKNDADVFKLLQFFGTRQEYYFGLALGEIKTMQTFVASNLSQEKINIINSNYAAKGIKFRW